MSISVADVKPGQFISFDMVSPLITANYRNVKVLANTNYDMAVGVTDVDSIHANIYDTLPTGTPRLARDFNYLIIEVNGEREAVGIPWIKDPVTVVSEVVFDVQVRGLDQTEGVALIQSALNSRGITDFSISVNGSKK